MNDESQTSPTRRQYELTDYRCDAAVPNDLGPSILATCCNAAVLISRDRSIGRQKNCLHSSNELISKSRASIPKGRFQEFEIRRVSPLRPPVPFDSVRRFQATLLLRTTCMRL